MRQDRQRLTHDRHTPGRSCQRHGRSAPWHAAAWHAAAWKDHASLCTVRDPPLTANERASDFPELRLLDVDQLCELWGVKKSWIYDQVEAGKLPVVRLGRQLRFREADLVSYLGNLVA